MSFLKKFGLGFLKVVGVIAGVTPLIQVPISQASVDGVLDKITQMFNVIMSVEAMFVAAYGTVSGLGSDKLKAAVPFIAQLLQTSAPFIGKKIKDPVLFEKACTGIASTLADALNALGE